VTRRIGEVAVAVALVAVVGWPALATAIESVRDEMSDVGAIPIASGTFASLRPVRLAWETIKLVALTEGIALPLGIAAGLIVFRTNAWGRRALLLLLGMALFVPMPLHALGWLGSFGNMGRSQAIGTGPILFGLPGAAFVHAMAALPWVAIVSGMGFRTVERELEESALMDRSAPWVMLRITLRRSLGAIAGAALAVAVLTAGDMTITDLLQVRTFAEESYIRSQLGLGQGASAAVVSLPMLIVLGLLIGWAARAILKAEPERLPSAEVAAPPFKLGAWRIPVGLASWTIASVLVGLPLYGLIWRSGRVGRPLRWSVSGLRGTLSAAWVDLTAATAPGPFLATLDSRPLVGTLIWASCAAFATVAIAWPLAWLARDSRGWRFVAGLSAAVALSAPGPVAGVALKLAYLMVPPIHDTPAILVLAYVLRTFPYALLILWPAVRGIAPEHLESAEVDGLSPWMRAWRIGLPMTRAAIVAAWVAAMVLALGELPAAYFVAPPGHDPLARVIWGMLHTGVESHLAGIGLILVGGVALVGVVAALAMGRAFRL